MKPAIFHPLGIDLLSAMVLLSETIIIKGKSGYTSMASDKLYIYLHIA